MVSKRDIVDTILALCKLVTPLPRLVALLILLWLLIHQEPFGFIEASWASLSRALGGPNVLRSSE